MQVEVHESLDFSYGRRPTGKVTLGGNLSFSPDMLWLNNCLSLRVQIVVRVVSAPERLGLSSSQSDNASLEAALFTRLRGFSRVVDLIVSQRLTVVGHNCFLDLMLIYQGRELNLRFPIPNPINPPRCMMKISKI